jgi:putative resolvase
MPYVKPKVATAHFGVSIQTLRTWAREGRIQILLSKGGYRLYDINSYQEIPSIPSPKQTDPTKKKYAYCRVSSHKQKEDLERQVQYMRDKYPTHEIIQEIASGINFKRKVLQRILDEAIRGMVGEIVVAHKDRLCRIAWDHFHWLFSRLGTTILVDSNEIHSPQSELSEDLLTIIHVFSCRHYAQRRKYRKRIVIEESVEEKGETEPTENKEAPQEQPITTG